MTMVEVLKTKYWSRADAFLLPLTGIPKQDRINIESHLFWNEYTIYDYNLILSIEHNNINEIIDICNNKIFPILDRKGYLMESYDIRDKFIMILDMSQWATDIQTFLAGKYSKFTNEARSIIEKYHTFNKFQIPLYIYAVLYPNEKLELLDNMSPIEYCALHYGINLTDLQKIGEIGSIYDQMSETLITNIEYLCNSDTKV